MNELDVSKIGYRWKGVYAEGNTYAKGDVWNKFGNMIDKSKSKDKRLL